MFYITMVSLSHAIIITRSFECNQQPRNQSIVIKRHIYHFYRINTCIISLSGNDKLRDFAKKTLLHYELHIQLILSIKFVVFAIFAFP